MKRLLFNNSKRSTSQFSSGFTLVELLVVVAIIGILSTVVLVAINPAIRVQAARDSQRKSDLAQIRSSLEAYASANNGKYPSTGGVFQCDDCGASDNPATTFGPDNWIPNLVSSGFIKQLPHDPQNGNQAASNCVAGSSYGYVYVSDQTNYKLMAYCMPKTDINNQAGVVQSGSGATAISSYCPVAGSDDASSFTASPAGLSTLQSMVDPKRPRSGYAVYSEGFTCK